MWNFHVAFRIKNCNFFYFWEFNFTGQLEHKLSKGIHIFNNNISNGTNCTVKLLTVPISWKYLKRGPLIEKRDPFNINSKRPIYREKRRKNIEGFIHHKTSYCSHLANKSLTGPIYCEILFKGANWTKKKTLSGPIYQRRKKILAGPFFYQLSIY